MTRKHSKWNMLAIFRKLEILSKSNLTNYLSTLIVTYILSVLKILFSSVSEDNKSQNKEQYNFIVL